MTRAPGAVAPAPCCTACKLSSLAPRVGGADFGPLWPQPTPTPAIEGKNRSLRRTLAAAWGDSQDSQHSQEAAGGREGPWIIPSAPVLPNLQTSSGTSFAKRWVSTGRDRVRVVSRTLVTLPLLWSVFDSVRSLPQTFDLCSVKQHHPSPRRLLAGVGGVRGSHRVALAPASLS